MSREPLYTAGFWHLCGIHFTGAMAAAFYILFPLYVRFLGGSEELSIDFGQLIRSIGNISMNIAINKRFNVQLSDTLNGYRAIRREVGVALKLIENKHTIEQEMVIRALRTGHKVKNVAAHEYARKHGTSHIRIWREWPHFLWCMFKNLYL